MTKDNRKQKKRKRKKIRTVFIIILVFYLSIRMFSSIYSASIKTTVVKNGTIEILEKTQGIVIRNEKVYKSNSRGKIVYFKDDGDKLGIGTKIAEISISNMYSELKQELIEIDSKLKELKDENISKKIFEVDIDKNKKNIDGIIDKLRENIIDGNYENVEQLKEQLSTKVEFQKKLLGQGGYVGYSIENLTKRKNEIMEEMKNLKREYYSDTPGLISFQIDGLEDIFSYKKISEYTPDDFKMIERRVINLEEKDTVDIGDPLFKICDNFRWFVIVKLSKGSLDSLKEGQDVYIRFSENSENIKANVYRISIKGNDTLIIFECNDYLYKFLNKRYVDIEIVKKKYEGLKIPKTAIVNKNGIKGVYVNDVGNIIKFRPIKIKGEDEEYAIVYEGEKINIGTRGKIEIDVDGKKEKRYTITLFDRVIINGNKVKE